MTDLAGLLLFGAGVFILAGLVKGVTGLGLPTVAMGLLSLVVAPAEAAAAMLLPSLVTNVWQMLAGPALAALTRRLWPMLVGACVGTWAGAGLLAGGGPLPVTGLGIALILYALLAFAAPQIVVPPAWERWLGPIVGVATGIATGATGVFVIPAVPYMQALRLERDALVQALGLSFTVSTVALALGLANERALAWDIVGLSALALVPAGLGMLLGQWLRERVSAQTFRRLFFAALFGLGLHLALRVVL